MDFTDFSFDTITTMVNKVKNAVMQYTEFEIKVREATSNESWGASSTLMQEIADGTHNYQHFNEIMSTIYKRLEEPPGAEWRKIYKSLQLLEFLIKHGSEKVIDAARSHMYELKALKNYSYIDEKHKDQGINIRMRAKEVIELLGDSEKIQTERQKAKENKTKYTGVSSSSTSSGIAGRFGGFGNSSFTSEPRSDASYSRSQETRTASAAQPDMSFEKYKVKKEPVIQAAPPKPVAEANLLDFGDEPIVPGQPPAITQKMNVETDQSEDWGDFSAAPQSPQGQDFSSPTQTIANTALPTAIRQNQNVTSPTNNSSFANFASFPATIKSNPAAPPNVPTNNATNADPLFNLVSLEADALSSRSNNRKDAPGPSLNQIQASQIDALSKDIWRGNR